MSFLAAGSGARAGRGEAGAWTGLGLPDNGAPPAPASQSHQYQPTNPDPQPQPQPPQRTSIASLTTSDPAPPPPLGPSFGRGGVEGLSPASLGGGMSLSLSPASTASTSVHSLKHSPAYPAAPLGHDARLLMERALSEPGVLDANGRPSGRDGGQPAPASWRRSASTPATVDRPAYEPLLVFGDDDGRAEDLDVADQAGQSPGETPFDFDGPSHPPRPRHPRKAAHPQASFPTGLPHGQSALTYQHAPVSLSNAFLSGPSVIRQPSHTPSPPSSRTAPRTSVPARPVPDRTRTDEQEIQAVAALAGFRTLPAANSVPGPLEGAVTGLQTYPSVLPPLANRAAAPPHLASGGGSYRPHSAGRSSSGAVSGAGYGLLLRSREDDIVEPGSGRTTPVPDGDDDGDERATLPPGPAREARQRIGKRKPTTSGRMVKLEPGVDLAAIAAAKVLSGADVGPQPKAKRPRTAGAGAGASARAGTDALAREEGAAVERHSFGMMDEDEIDARLRKAANLVQSATSATAQERALSLWVQDWIGSSYEAHATGTVSRTCLFTRYNHAAAAYGVKASNAASFGKAMKTRFGEGVKTRRLGVRGNSRYHYIGLRPTHRAEAERLHELDVAEAAVPPRQVYVKKGRTGKRGPQQNPARNRTKSESAEADEGEGSEGEGDGDGESESDGGEAVDRVKQEDMAYA